MISERAHVRCAEGQAAEVEVAGGAETFEDVGDGAGLHDVVGAEDPAVLAPGEGDRAGHVPVDSAAGVLAVVADGVVGREGLDDRGRVVGRPAVEDDDLDAVDELRDDAGEGLADEGAEVVGRDADREADRPAPAKRARRSSAGWARG